MDPRVPQKWRRSMVAGERSVCSRARSGDDYHGAWGAGQGPRGQGPRGGSRVASPCTLDPPLGPWPLALDPYMGHLFELAPIRDRDLAPLHADQTAVLKFAHRARYSLPARADH